MAIRRYLAMTASEFGTYGANLPALAYMACHFSPYGRGLSNLPTRLPKDSMLILNDRIPIAGHDPILIREQLTQSLTALGCSRVLLDFQRPGEPETSRVVQALDKALPCPVGVSECYAGDFSGPVFLPPVPPDTPISDCLSPWAGREIWLEEAPEGLAFTVTSQGAKAEPLSPALFPENGRKDGNLHCHYRIRLRDDRADFSLWRTEGDLEALAREAEALGVTCRVGLWQDWLI